MRGTKGYGDKGPRAGRHYAENAAEETYRDQQHLVLVRMEKRS